MYVRCAPRTTPQNVVVGFSPRRRLEFRPAMTLLALMMLSQVQVQIQAPLPVIRFEAPPPLVVIEPGIQVVPEHDEEIFFVDGWYWHRKDGRWFRTRDHRGNWVVVEERV